MCVFSASRGALSVLVTLVLLTVSPFVVAQTSDRERASQLVQEARDAEAAGDEAGAVRAYHEAFLLSRDPAIAFNLAVHYDGQGDIARAWFYAQQYITLFPGAPDRNDVESFLAEWAAQLPTTSAQLIVESSPAGADVVRISEGFEELLGTTPLEIWITPGAVTLELRRDRYEVHRDRFNAVAGLRLPIETRLERMPDAPTTTTTTTTTTTPEVARTATPTQPPPEPRSKIPGIVVTSGGALVMLAAVPFALGASSAADEYNDLIRTIGIEEGNADAPDRSQRISDLRNRHDLNRGLMWGSIGVGAVLTGVGTYLLIRSSSSTSTAWSPTRFAVGPTEGGAAASWSFSF
jgi:hypothetical protein